MSVEQLVILIDGRFGDAVEAARALNLELDVRHLPMILLEAAKRSATLSERRHFVTSIPCPASDDHILAAISIAATKGSMSKVSDSIAPGRAPIGSAPKVLLADPSASNRLVITRQLNSLDYECVAVENGLDALDALGGDFECILLDVDMPGMDGFETASLIRHVGFRYHQLPIFGMTDTATPDLRRQASAASMTKLLVRPLETETVAELLRELAKPTIESITEEVDQHHVDPITVHPRFKAGKGPPLTDRTLSHLSFGDRFTHELKSAFQEDMNRTCDGAYSAIEVGSLSEFQAQLRSIRSIATTLHAPRLTQLCLESETVSEERLGFTGRALLQQIKDEVLRIGKELI